MMGISKNRFTHYNDIRRIKQYGEDGEVLNFIENRSKRVFEFNEVIELFFIEYFNQTGIKPKNIKVLLSFMLAREVRGYFYDPYINDQAGLYVFSIDDNLSFLFDADGAKYCFGFDDWIQAIYEKRLPKNCIAGLPVRGYTYFNIIEIRKFAESVIFGDKYYLEPWEMYINEL